MDEASEAQLSAAQQEFLRQQEDLGRELASQIRSAREEQCKQEEAMRKAQGALDKERRKMQRALELERQKLHSEIEQERRSLREAAESQSCAASAGPAGPHPHGPATETLKTARGTGGERTTAGEEATRGRLNMLTDGPWLAKELGLASAPAQGAGHEHLELLVDLPGLWRPVWASLPPSSFGCGPQEQRFGLAFAAPGGAAGADGPRRLVSAALCPEAFVWEPSAAVGPAPSGGLQAVLDALHEDLNGKLRSFLSEKFAPWIDARLAEQDGSRGEPAAVLVCNDGDAFALPPALLGFLGAEGGGAPWRSIALVADRSKSSASDAALEAFALRAAPAGPRRVVFDVVA